MFTTYFYVYDAKHACMELKSNICVFIREFFVVALYIHAPLGPYRVPNACPSILHTLPLLTIK